jgi:hypothetical protein
VAPKRRRRCHTIAERRDGIAESLSTVAHSPSYFVDTGLPLCTDKPPRMIIRRPYPEPQPSSCWRSRSKSASTNPHRGRPLRGPDDYPLTARLAFFSSLWRCQRWQRGHRQSYRAEAGHRSSRHQHARNGRHHRRLRDTSNLTCYQDRVLNDPRCSCERAAYSTLGARIRAQGRCRN